MKTIIRIIPGQDPDKLLPFLARDLEKAMWEVNLYQGWVDNFIAELFPRGKESEKEQWLNHKSHIGDGHGERDLYSLEKAKEKQKRIEDDIEKMSKQGIINPVIEFVTIHSYEQKDQLKSRGYRFDRGGYWLDPVGLKVMPAWIKRIEVKPENETIIKAEYLFLKSLGDVEGDNYLNRITAGIREGRVVSTGVVNG